MRKLAIFILCCCFFSGGQLSGQEQYYGEIGLGMGKVGFDSSDFWDPGFDSFGLWAGYPFSDGFSVEAGFMNLGEFEDRIFYSDKGGSGFVTFSADSVINFNLGVRGTLPVTEAKSLHARAGLSLWDVDVSVDGNPANVDTTEAADRFFTESSNGVDFYLGWGATIDISPKNYLMVEYWYVEADGVDMIHGLTGLGFKF